MDLVFVELPHFTNAVADYFEDDEAYRSLQEHLLHSPTAGSVMKGCGGLRKVRWRDPKRGKGKRSGLRVIYLYLPEFEKLALFDVYDKDESEDLDPQEKRILSRAADSIRKEFQRRRM